jgi:hypothetical protein
MAPDIEPTGQAPTAAFWRGYGRGVQIQRGIIRPHVLNGCRKGLRHLANLLSDAVIFLMLLVVAAEADVPALG